MGIYDPLAMEASGLRIYVECGADRGSIRAVACVGESWRIREEVVNGDFDLAFSRVLVDLRRRLGLNERQMAWLESYRHGLGSACGCSDAAA